jgi:hypothetical protein
MSKKWYNLFVSTGPTAAGQAPAAETPPSAAQTVAEIAARLGAPPAALKPVADPTSFAEIYAAAQIAVPAHGYTIFKIADMLQSEHIRSLPSGVKKSTILVALEAAGVKLEDVIADAVQRDRALDTFEAVQQRSLDDFEKAKAAENQALQAEMDRIVAEKRAAMQKNETEIAAAREKLRSWTLQKAQEEQRISDTVAYFATENPITTGPAPAAPPPKPKGQG